jgi:hypothetical protein
VGLLGTIAAVLQAVSAEHEKQADVILVRCDISWPYLLQLSRMQLGMVVLAEHTVITCSIPRSHAQAQSCHFDM